MTLGSCSDDDDTSSQCPTVLDGGSCLYAGYGTKCTVACTLPTSCRFRLQVNWTGGGFCCPGADSVFESCSCVDGKVLCSGYGAKPEPPVTYCEFCDRDTGVRFDASDAGPVDADAPEQDASDADSPAAPSDAGDAGAPG